MLSVAFEGWKKWSEWAKPDVSIRKQLQGKGQIQNLEHNKNLNGINIKEILEKTPVELEQMVKDGQLTDKQLKTIKKTFEGRDLGSKGRGH